MTLPNWIPDALKDLDAVDLSHGQILVNTHCLYPSNIQVRVSVTAIGENTVRVSDDALGIGQILTYGIETQKPGYFLAEQAGKYNIRYSKGEVFTDVSSADKLAAAVMLVANASKDGVLRMYLAHEINTSPSFDFEFEKYIRDRHSNKFRPGTIDGASGKTRTFRYIHQSGNLPEVRLNERIVLVEPVSPGQMIIGMKTLAHRDIMSRKLPNIWQRLVVDKDVDKWTKADIALLDQSSVPWIEFHSLELELPKLVA